MASRKRVLDDTDNLFGAVIPVTPKAKALPMPESMHGVGDEFGGEDFPSAPAPAPLPPPAERPKLTIVPPPPDEDVTVEATDDGRFWLSFIRLDGGIRGALLVTEKQLRQFISRGTAALEVG